MPLLLGFPSYLLGEERGRIIWAQVTGISGGGFLPIPVTVVEER